MKPIMFIIVTCLSVCGGYVTARVLDKTHVIMGESKNE